MKMARNVYEYGRGGKCAYMFRYTYAGIRMCVRRFAVPACLCSPAQRALPSFVCWSVHNPQGRPLRMLVHRQNSRLFQLWCSLLRPLLLLHAMCQHTPYTPPSISPSLPSLSFHLCLSPSHRHLLSLCLSVSLSLCLSVSLSLSLPLSLPPSLLFSVTVSLSCVLSSLSRPANSLSLTTSRSCSCSCSCSHSRSVYMCVCVYDTLVYTHTLYGTR